MLCPECPFSLECFSGALEAERRIHVCGECKAVLVVAPVVNAYALRIVTTLCCEPVLNHEVEFNDYNRGLCPRCRPWSFITPTRKESKTFRHYVGPHLCLTHKQWQYRHRKQRGQRR